MKNDFTKEEKKAFRMKNHIKTHLFEYILDIICPVLLTLFMLHICKAQNYIYGVIISLAYSSGKVVYSILHYKKEYIDLDIK